MPELVWYRSLYWRIGLGFIACVAGLLVAQAVLFIWLTAPGQGTPNGSPQRLAAIVANDISNALDGDPSLDIAKYAHDNYDQAARPIAIFLRDGRMISTRRYDPPPQIVRAARIRLERGIFEGARSRGADGRGGGADDDGDGERGGGRGSGESGGRGGEPGGRGSDPGGPGGFRERGGRPPLFGRIVAGGQVIGLVVTPFDGPPWLAAMREHGPMLVLVGIVLLLSGTAVMAFFIFRPASAAIRAT